MWGARDGPIALVRAVPCVCTGAICAREHLQQAFAGASICSNEHLHLAPATPLDAPICSQTRLAVTRQPTQPTQAGKFPPSLYTAGAGLLLALPPRPNCGPCWQASLLCNQLDRKIVITSKKVEASYSFLCTLVRKRRHSLTELTHFLAYTSTFILICPHQARGAQVIGRRSEHEFNLTNFRRQIKRRLLSTP